MENQTFFTTVNKIAIKYGYLARTESCYKESESKPNNQDGTYTREELTYEQIISRCLRQWQNDSRNNRVNIWGSLDIVAEIWLPKEQMLDLFLHFRKDLMEKYVFEDNYVYGILTEEEEATLVENLDDIKEKIATAYFSPSSDLIIPEDFSRLIAGMISNSDGCNLIFVPSFCLNVSYYINGCHVVGIEQDARIRAFSSVLAEEKGIDMKLYPSMEAMYKDLGEGVKFDAVIATEPGTATEKVDEALLRDYYSNLLVENGLFFTLVRSSYLSQLACKDERSFMHDMIERCAIKSIIQFPTYFWERANEAVSLVCVKNCSAAKYEDEWIKSLECHNAPKDIIEEWRRRRQCSSHKGIIMVYDWRIKDDSYIDADQVLHDWSNDTSAYIIKDYIQENGIFDHTDSQEVTYDRIDKSGGILLPEYHLLQYLTKEEMLGNCAEVAKTTSVGSGASVPYVSEEHLSDVATGRPLSVEGLPSAQNAKTVVTGPAVVMHYAGSAVKTAIIDANVDFAIGDNMFAFSPKCDPEYLECVLHHDLTLHVCESKAYPLTTEMILAQIIVDRNYDEKVGYTLRTLGENVQALERKAKEEYDNYQKEIHIRRHAMSQVVSALSADWRRIFNGLNKSGSLNLSDTLGRLNPITVSDLVRSISEKIDVLSSQTAHLAEVEYEWGDPEPINVADYLAKYSESNRSDRFRYDTDPSNLQRCRSISINATADALNRVFDSIISNALSHGFTDKTRTDYSVRFRCKPDSGKIRIFIDNNGCALPEGYIGREDSLKMYGVSTSLNKDGHSGIGCYDAENIVKHFGGSLSLKSIDRDPDGYTVSYILEFPIVK